MTSNEVSRTVEQRFLVRVDMDTSSHQDLVLRQLLRQIPGWFADLTPAEISEVLASEAHHLTAKYPVPGEY